MAKRYKEINVGADDDGCNVAKLTATECVRLFFVTHINTFLLEQQCNDL
jgi:hypothetical protein